MVCYYHVMALLAFEYTFLLCDRWRYHTLTSAHPNWSSLKGYWVFEDPQEVVDASGINSPQVVSSFILGDALIPGPALTSDLYIFFIYVATLIFVQLFLVFSIW